MLEIDLQLCFSRFQANLPVMKYKQTGYVFSFFSQVDQSRL